MNDRAGFVRDGAIAGSTGLAVNVATLGFYTVGVRHLNVASGGLLLSLIAATLLLSMPAAVAGLAFGTAAGRLSARGDRPLLARLTAVAACAALVIAAAALGASFAARSGLGHFFLIAQTDAVVAAGAVVAANASLVLFRGIIQGVGLFTALAVSNLLEMLGRIAIIVVLLRSEQSVTSIMLLLFIVLSVASGAALVALVRETGCSFDFHRTGVPEFSGSLPIFVTMGGLTALTFMDAIAARHFLSPRDGGIYNAAALAGRALMTLLAFAPAVVMPRIAAAEVDGGNQRDIVMKTFAFTAAVCVPAALLFAFFPQLVIHIVAGPAFADAATFVPRYGFAACALAAASVLASLQLGLKTSRIAWYVGPAALLEIGAIVAYHPSAEGLLDVVAIGHGVMLCAVIAATIRPPRASESA